MACCNRPRQCPKALSGARQEENSRGISSRLPKLVDELRRQSYRSSTLTAALERNSLGNAYAGKNRFPEMLHWKFTSRARRAKASEHFSARASHFTLMERPTITWQRG